MSRMRTSVRRVTLGAESILRAKQLWLSDYLDLVHITGLLGSTVLLFTFQMYTTTLHDMK